MEHILSQLAKTKSGPSLLRREFRISGQTGETGQTEKLTFASLMHQIDSGLKRDYQENENSNWRGSSHRGRGRGCQPNRTSWGCQNCKQRGDVTIALLVVTRGMWLGNVTVTRTGVVSGETADDYSRGTRNSRKQQ